MHPLQRPRVHPQLLGHSNVVIQDSYSGNLSTNNGSIHSESVDADSSNHVTIEHSYLVAHPAPIA